MARLPKIVTLSIFLLGNVLAANSAHAEINVIETNPSRPSQSVQPRQVPNSNSSATIYQESQQQVDPSALQSAMDSVKSQWGVSSNDFSQTVTAARQLMQHPLFIKLVGLMKDPKFRDAVQGILKFDGWKKLLIVNIIVIVLIGLFKAYKSTRYLPNEWPARAWLDVWTAGLTIVLVSVAVPSILIGPPYRQMLGTFVSHAFA